MTLSKEDVLEKAKQLADLIAESESVATYKKIERQLGNNEKFSELMEKRKQLQKESVNLEQLEKLEALADVKKQLIELNELIDEMPIVHEFKDSQSEVNELLQTVTMVISKELE